MSSCNKDWYSLLCPAFWCTTNCSGAVIINRHTYAVVQQLQNFFNYQCIPLISNKKKVDFKAQWSVCVISFLN